MKNICKTLLIIFSLLTTDISVQASITSDTLYHAVVGTSVPDLTNLKHVRFLTTDDFYPFNYRPEKGMPIAGYNVDLMRAICKELNVLPKCQLEPVPFNQLIPYLKKGEGDAIMAGLSADQKDTPSDISFSNPYLLFPARFLCLTANYEKLKNKPLDQQRIGVLRDTKHVQMLREYFSKILYTEYSTTEQLTNALQKGNIDAIFGDGRALAVLTGPYSFEGKPYYNQNYLGTGMRVAVLSKRRDVLDAINYALERLARSGELYMIYLRYFPRNFY